MNQQWALEDLRKLYFLPLMELVSQAHTVHLRYHTLGEIQICYLISVKTGGCPEDCKYCAQSARYQTPTKAEPFLKYETVMEMAKQAAKKGVTRVCLGAAWKEVRDNHYFNEVLRMIKGITSLGVEVCCTLGKLKPEHAEKLKEAGLYAYNHNLDTSREYYKTIITTRTYDERLKTLDIVEEENLSVCCGGIIGIGETAEDRLGLLWTLAQRERPPESIPINFLEPIPGTPLADQPKLPFWEMLRMIALTRIVFPKAMVRLSGGRIRMGQEEQLLCFFAGANSIFSGEKLLTVPGPSFENDRSLFQVCGLTPRPAFLKPRGCS